jgi:hypothetical protein
MQRFLFLQKITNKSRIIGVGISVIFVVMMWLLPLPTHIDVGSVDVPWVSDFYATQQQNETTYRWSHQRGNIIFTGLGGGEYTLQLVMRSVQPTEVQVIIDDTTLATIAVTNQFYEYTVPINVPWQSNGEFIVTIQCPTAQLDGKRPVCVAIDEVTVTPQGSIIPSLWPLLLMMAWVGGIVVLLWQWVRQWWWWSVVAVLLLMLHVFAYTYIVFALPYLVVITGAIAGFQYATTQPPTRVWFVIQCATLAAVITTVRFAFQGSVGLMLEDEGFLWYGSQRILAGELPMRDFFGYDLPRYIWNALVMFIVGSKGIYALRIAIALCEWVTLTMVCVILMLLQIRWRSVVFLLGIITVAFWLYPRHKIYDHAVIWFMIVAFWWWVSNPTNHRTFWAGVVVGVITMIGRNHGVYAICAGSLLLGYVWSFPIGWMQRFRLALIWGCGIVVGFAPMILAMVAIPSFGQGYIEIVWFFLQLGKTNLPLPVPWPWSQTTVDAVLVGLWFLVPVVTYVVTLGVVFWRRWHNYPISVGVPVVTVVGLVYLQVVYSRADMPHLAQGIPPFIVLVLLLTTYVPQRFQIAIMLVLCSWSASVNWNTAWQSTWISSKDRQEVTVTNQLTVPNTVAKQLALIMAIHQKYAPNNESFVVTPYWPGAYALWEQTSPLYNTYILYSFDETTQNREIRRLQQSHPQFILIDDSTIDNQKQQRFMVNYAFVDTYIRTQYRQIYDPIVPKNMRLYVPNP